MVEDDIVGCVARLTEFLKHDRFLALDFVGIKPGAANKIGDQVEPESSILSEQSGVKHGHVARGIRVQRAADVFDFLGDGARRSGCRALEDHMLEQMRNAVGPFHLEPCPGIDVKAKRNRIDMVHRARDDADAVGQGREPGHSAAAASDIGVARWAM